MQILAPEGLGSHERVENFLFSQGFMLGSGVRDNLSHVAKIPEREA